MEQEKKIQYLNMDDVLPNRFQPRIKFDESSLTELTESIKEHGVIQPITVRPLGDKYEIIAGERRYKASTLAGKTTIPAIIVELNDKDSAEVALIENVQRRDLTPIEEAISYKKILDMNYLNQEQLATKLGKNQSTIANKLRLLNLSEEVQEALLDEKISERHARSLLRLEDKNLQNQMLNRIIQERLTVRRTDEEIDKMNSGNDIEIMDFDLELEKPKQETPVSDVGISEIPEVVPSPKEEEMDKFYNIPSGQIIEDKEDKIISPVPPVEINPGFMNVDKIEKEANDIYTEKPVANLEELLKSPVSATNPVLPKEEEKPETEEELKPKTGRFFTLLDPEEEEEKPTFSPVEPTASKPSLLDQLNSDAKVITSDGFSSTQDAISSPTTAFTAFDTMPTPAKEDTLKQLDAIQKQVDAIDPTTAFAFNPDTPMVNTLPEGEFLNAQPAPEPETNNTNRYTADLKTVINTIRNCSETIEKYGYEVDMEEFDFEDMYQVIFKVKKNNK